MKKKSTIFLAIFLCITSLCGLFGLTACGEVSLATVKKSLNSLVETYSTYSDYLVLSGSADADNLALKVNLGENIKAHAVGNAKYTSLTSTYGEILEISNNYIMQNKEYIEGLSEKQLSNSAKDALKSLNSNINSYKSQISKFISEMNDFDAYLGRQTAPSEEEQEEEPNQEGEMLYLIRFKRAYGTLVSRNIALSTSVANFVEKTGVFNLLKGNVPSDLHFKLIKSYIRIKLLPVFSKYKIDKIENVYDFDSMKERGDAFVKVENQLTKLDSLYTTFKTRLVPNKVGNIGTTDTEKNNKLNDLFDISENFFKEEKNYFTAVSGINFYELAKTGYDIDSYSAKNNKFLRYMDTIDTFLGVGVNASSSNKNGKMEEFIQQVCSLLGV